jgi:hypothetical protein
MKNLWRFTSYTAANQMLEGTRLWRGWSRSTPNTRPPHCVRDSQSCSLKVLWKKCLRTYRPHAESSAGGCQSCWLATIHWDTNCMLWASWITLDAWNVDRKRNPSTSCCQIPDLAQERLRIFSSVWLWPTDISMASIKQVLALALRKGLLLKALRVHNGPAVVWVLGAI